MSPPTSTEARRHLAAIWYAAILGRAPSSSETSAWATAMAAGSREISLIAGLAARLESTSG